VCSDTSRIAELLFGESLIRGLGMVTNRSGGVVFVCFFVLAIVAGKLFLRSNPTAWTDLVPESWLSKEDKKVLNDPKPPASKSFDQLGGESWQRYKAQQPQGGWSQGWRK
jgi:hypothetical protein